MMTRLLSIDLQEASASRCRFWETPSSEHPDEIAVVLLVDAHPIRDAGDENTIGLVKSLRRYAHALSLSQALRAARPREMLVCNLEGNRRGAQEVWADLRRGAAKRMVPFFHGGPVAGAPF